MHAVVAGSLTHASALIKWAQLNPETFVPLAYGQTLDSKVRYGQALLVRPTEGVSEADQEWICSVLLPQVDGPFGTHPLDWKPYHDTAQKLLGSPVDAPQLEENPLWA